MRAIAVPVLGVGGAVAGVVDVTAALTPSPSGVVDRAAWLMGLQPLDRPQTAMLGVAALVYSQAIFRGRQAALWTSVAVLAVLLLVALPHHPARLAVLAALLVLLVLERQEFRARPDPRRLRRAAMVGTGVLAGLITYWAWDALVRRESPWHADGARADLVVFTVAAALLVMFILALGPAAPPAPGTAMQRADVLSLANHPDSDSLAPFAARWDKSYVFSTDHRAALGYRVVLGTAIASGDPVGERASGPAAMAGFIDLCRARGWRPAVLGASDRVATGWRDLGLRGLVIGDEAVLDVGSFSLDSRRMRNVRQAVARTRRSGIDVRIGPMTPALGRSLEPVLADWLDGHQLRGFSMNLDQTLAPRADAVVASAYGPDGEAMAFALFAVCGDGRILTMDVAPRRHDAPNGIVERLIVETVEYARSTGAAEVSLNFAGLRRIFESSRPLDRAAAGLAHAFDTWIELAPLYRFCAKFHPQWRARSLMMGSWASVAAVGVAAVVAEMRATPPAVEPEGPPEPYDEPEPIRY